MLAKPRGNPRSERVLNLDQEIEIRKIKKPYDGDKRKEESARTWIWIKYNGEYEHIRACVRAYNK